MPRKTPVRWTDDEWLEIAYSVWTMRKNNPASSMVALTNKAQKTFKPSRQKVIAANSQLTRLAALLKKIDTEYAAAHRDVERLQQSLEDVRKNSVTKEEVLETLTDAEVDRYFRPRVLKTLPVDILLQSVSPDEMLDAIPLERLASYTVLSLVNMMRRACEPNDHAAGPGILTEVVKRSTQTPARVPRKTKICVIGLKDEQHNIITAAVNGQATMVYRKADGLTARTLPKTCDWYFLWTNFIDHKAQELVKKHIPRDRVRYVTGGLDTIRKRVVQAATQTQAA